MIANMIDNLMDSFLGFMLLFVSGAAVLVGAIIFATAWGVARPSCMAKGEAMGIETQWGFYTGCMINVRGQLLPWSEVVPVERNGRIVFEPKPYVRLAPPEQSN
jgi:hypothetical protein